MYSVLSVILLDKVGFPKKIYDICFIRAKLHIFPFPNLVYPQKMSFIYVLFCREGKMQNAKIENIFV